RTLHTTTQTIHTHTGTHTSSRYLVPPAPSKVSHLIPSHQQHHDSWRSSFRKQKKLRAIPTDHTRPVGTGLTPARPVCHIPREEPCLKSSGPGSVESVTVALLRHSASVTLRFAAEAKH
ncbi:hypothetical protein RB213_000126, partial [Colletotrichum asianum]